MQKDLEIGFLQYYLNNQLLITRQWYWQVNDLKM